MSESDGGETLSSQILYTEKPYVYIFIPLAVFVTVGVAVTCCQFRRRRRRIRALQLHRDGGRALAQDVEALGGTGTSGTATTVQPPATINGRPFVAGSQGAGGSRWQWLQAQREQERALARAEDGLNELGEAPPPYIDASKDTELRVLDVNVIAVPPPAMTTTTTATTVSATAVATANTRGPTAATSRSSTEVQTTVTSSSSSQTTPEGHDTSTATTTEEHQEQGVALPPAYSAQPAEGATVTRPAAAVVAVEPGHLLRGGHDR